MQPIPSNLKGRFQSQPKMFNTLLVDGPNILQLCYHGCKQLSPQGEEIGGVFQFLLQLKIMLKKANFRHVWVFWDGENSGQNRYNLYPMYKQNRDKNYNDDNLSPYMRKVNERVKTMQAKAYSSVKNKRSNANEKEEMLRQQQIIMECLEEMFVRQFMFEETEADDLIAFYVMHKIPSERIVILSCDRDLTQLISNSVIIFNQKIHNFINRANSAEVLGYDYRNVVLVKTLCGDPSDNIKGIKGLGETTLLRNFGELKTGQMELSEIIDRARQINKQREGEKKKPLKWAENIVNAITDGVQGEYIYEINEQIIDLRNPECPMMPEQAKMELQSMMYAPLNPEGRTMTNLYDILQRCGIEELQDPIKFSNFFLEFKRLIEEETKNIT